MQRISLDHDKALVVLRLAVKQAGMSRYAPTSKQASSINAIMSGSHLTYKYILVTALLAKATDDRVHALALQAGADLNGAYDARSLCHSVIVPNEKTLMGNALGGSNEPFLNKPARFPLLSLTNPVRPGQDKRTLQTLYATLTAIRNSDQAFAALKDAISAAMRRKKKEAADLEDVVGELRGGRQEIGSYFTKLISKSMHGESCVLASAALFWLIAVSRGEKWAINVHPVNESGSSSNEIGDIDVRVGSTLLHTAEVKDKVFTAKDVDHAVSKVVKAGFHTLLFIRGPRGHLKAANYASLRIEAARSGIDLFSLELGCLADSIIPFAPREVTVHDFAAAVSRFAKEARVREDTLQHIKAVSIEQNSAGAAESGTDEMLKALEVGAS